MVPAFVGSTELLLIAALALLLFGGKKLPELMRGLGKGISEFKKGAREVSEMTSADDPDMDKVEEKR